MIVGVPTVSALRPGDLIEGVFACVGKERRMTRTGSPYLALMLRDRTGAISGRAFRDADQLAGRFERGDLVRVSGRVERFREELQLDVEGIARARGDEADPAAFLPVAYRDLGELEGFWEHLAREVTDPGFARVLGRVRQTGGLWAEVRRAPATRTGHHAYLGGLLEHTVAVAQLCLEVVEIRPRLERDLLLCAALVHDIGRTREFTYGAEIAVSEAGRLLGHLALGQEILSEVAGDLDPVRRTALLHCVLAHHGADPRSPEAVALHRANALDAAVAGALSGSSPGTAPPS